MQAATKTAELALKKEPKHRETLLLLARLYMTQAFRLEESDMLAGGLPSRAAARDLCRRLRAAEPGAFCKVLAN